MVDKIINIINVVLNLDVMIVKRSFRFVKIKNNGFQYVIIGLYLFFNEKYIFLQFYVYSFGLGLIFQRY